MVVLVLVFQVQEEAAMHHFPLVLEPQGILLLAASQTLEADHWSTSLFYVLNIQVNVLHRD